MITVLTGSNSFLLHQKLAALTDAHIQQQGDMSYERIDGEEAEYSYIIDALQSVPFLAPKKLVILRSPGLNKEFTKQYEAVLADMPETTDVVIVEPKVDKRSSYYKWLKKYTDFQEFTEMDERALSRWVVDRAAECGSKIALKDATYFVSRLGINQQLLDSEIQKLSLVYTNITQAGIDEVTESTPQTKIFDLLDAAFAGRTEKALHIYNEQRHMRVEPQEILAMVGWQLRQVALAKTAGTKHDLVREAGMRPFPAQKAQQIARRITFARLKRLIRTLTDIDAQSKREPIDLDEALKVYITTLYEYETV